MLYDGRGERGEGGPASIQHGYDDLTPKTAKKTIVGGWPSMAKWVAVLVRQRSLLLLKASSTTYVADSRANERETAEGVGGGGGGLARQRLPERGGGQQRLALCVGPESRV